MPHKKLLNNFPEKPVYSKILSFGSSIGEKVVTNDDLAQLIDSSDEWIQKRTGIATRRYTKRPISQLALEAAAEAIKNSGLLPDKIDTIIASTITHPFATPSLSSYLAQKLGCTGAAALDISAACAGYCYAVCQADSLIKSGLSENVLIVCAEKLTDIIDPKDRTISFILGDGAGACVISKSDMPKISNSIWGSDSGWETIYMTCGLDEVLQKQMRPTLVQDGPKVFKWAVYKIKDIAAEIIKKSGLTPGDIDIFIPHQANLRIILQLAKQIGLKNDVVIAQNISEIGNTSSASIPIATKDLIDKGFAKKGDIALQIGFGAGLVYAGQIIEIP